MWLRRPEELDLLVPQVLGQKSAALPCALTT